MNDDTRYRHELKYDINYSNYLALRSRIRHIMKSDEHSVADGKYLVRSVYFDNYRDKALKEKLNGTAEREKFRIRWYNDDLSFITLQKKQKVNSLTKKLITVWSESEFRSFISGDRTWMITHPSPLTRELYVKMKTQQLTPRVIVSYMRESYTFPAGNVRVTFDTDIRSARYNRDFLDNLTDVGVADEPGHTILEVKYDEFLPEIIACLLQSENCRQTAYSKYSESRRFG